MHRLTVLFLLGLAAVQAQVAAPAPDSPARQTFYARLRGLFDFDLPDIDPPGTVKLIVHPHFGDLVRRDYMRVDSGFRWALSHRFELTPEASVYFTHGLRDGGDGYGIGEVRLGSKYILPEWPARDMETSLTLNLERPTGHAPVDMTDGFNHVAPGLLVQRHLDAAPKWTLFSGVGLDLINVSKVAGTPVFNQPRDDSMNFTAGAIYDRGQVKYTLAGTYATTALLGDAGRDFYYLRPNVLWYVPKKYTFNSKTQWIIGLGARISWGPDGHEISFSNRVRAEITFRQVMQKMRFIGPDDTLTNPSER